MHKPNGASIAPTDIHFGQTSLEGVLLGESTKPETPIERPRQVEKLASEHEQAMTAEVSDRLKTGDRARG
jgi:hypothetical protein